MSVLNNKVLFTKHNIKYLLNCSGVPGPDKTSINKLKNIFETTSSTINYSKLFATAIVKNF